MENEGQTMELNITGDQGQSYTLIVTQENAQRALNDPDYGAILLAAAVEDVANFNTNSNLEDVANSAGPSEAVDDDGASLPLEDLTNTGKWSDDATKLLLAEYAPRKVLFEDPKRHKALWKVVTDGINGKRYTYSCKQVISKLDSMKRRYRLIRDKHGKSGNGRCHWMFFSEMDNIFGSKKTSNLGNMVDSDEPPADSPPPSSPSSVSEASASTASSKKRRNSHEVYLEGLFGRMAAVKAEEEEKKRAEREERERAREARHADKQEFRKSLLALLEQSLKRKD